MTNRSFDEIRELLYSRVHSDDLVTVRSSSRAKRLLFKSSVNKGVEIVVPRGADVLWVAEMVEQRIPWIRQSEQNVKKTRSELIPTEIKLEALCETWSVDYRKVDEIPEGLIINGNFTLMVGLNPKDILFGVSKLQDWFHKKAREALIPWLDSLAEARRLRFNRTFVRNPVSRWGSCSEKRNISLNRNLLFIPNHLVEYVLHHELTHLDHMNHSKRFWSSLKRILPNCLDLRRELKEIAPEDIPLWATPH